MKARQIASFRYNKPYLFEDPAEIIKVTQESQVNNLQAAVNLLRTNTKVDTSRIFLLGHDEGGNITTAVTRQNPEIAGLIAINSAAFAIDTIITERSRAKLLSIKVDSVPVEKAFQLIRNDQFPAEWQILGFGVQYWKQWIENSEKTQEMILAFNKPAFFIQTIKHDFFPSFTLYQNIAIWEELARQSDKISLMTYPDISHFLINPVTGQVAENILDDTIFWIKQH